MAKSANSPAYFYFFQTFILVVFHNQVWADMNAQAVLASCNNNVIIKQAAAQC